VLGGLQLGYNYQFNRNWLVGLETDFDGTGMKGSGSMSDSAGAFFSSPGERIDWFGTVRARLGYLPADNLLVYVTGGLAYGDVERTGAFTVLPGNGVAFSNNGTGFACHAGPGVSIVNGVVITSPTCFAGASRDIATGWTLGGGLEYAFSQRWTVKAEYLYVSLGGKSVNEIGAPNPNSTTPSSVNASFSHTNFNVARVGVNYRF
jgi:outer membrane immunogenic protein